MDATLTMPPAFSSPSANDQLKARFGSWLWGSMFAAAVIHFLILSFWPTFHVTDNSTNPDVISILPLPPVSIPPPPPEIARPAIPLLATNIDISEEITIAPTTFPDNPVRDLPAPPTGREADVGDQPRFTPYEVKPELRNRAEFARQLERAYPSILKDAGIGGTVVLWVFIDEAGSVKDTRITQSSGEETLDRVAQEVMRQARFSPALNRDQRVPVWIQLPVTFQTR